MTGIRAQVAVDAPGDCPVAKASLDAHQSVMSVNRSTVPSDETVVEEFAVNENAPLRDDDIDVVFSAGAETVYRFSREHRRGCVCRTVEGTASCPVTDVHANDGTLFVTFYASDLNTIRAVVGTLREQFGGVRVAYLARSTDDSTNHDVAFIDRSRLTDRQREVLRTAHEMGYFEYPKEANASDVAAELGIAPSTFSEHLSAAQSKLFEALLDT